MKILGMYEMLLTCLVKCKDIKMLVLCTNISVHTCITYENILGLVISVQKTTYETVQVHTSIEKSVEPSICAYVCISLFFTSFYTTQATCISADVSVLFTSVILLLYSYTFIDSESKDILVCSRIYLL